MALNIPNTEAPPGGFYGGAKAANALSRQMMENQTYMPDMQSQIGYRNALMQGQNIQNQYMPDKLKLANAYQQLQNQFYAPNIQSEIANRNALTNQSNTMTPLKAKQLELENQFYPELTQSQITSNKAMANYRNMGGGRMGVDQQAIQGLKNQIMQDNPGMNIETANQIAGAALNDENILPNGQPLPKLSGSVQSMIADINKKHSTAAIQNQAANMDILANDLNRIDIAPVARFAGAPGRLEYASYVADMAMGKPVPDDFRDYLSFKNISSTFAQDAMRKGFGTSVVPGYVFATLGKASNPNSTWWHDPKQVIKDWNTTKDWINKNAQSYKTKANRGATADISGENKKSSNEVIKFVRDPSGKLVRETS